MIIFPRGGSGSLGCRVKIRECISVSLCPHQGLVESSEHPRLPPSDGSSVGTHHNKAFRETHELYNNSQVSMEISR